jgi:hypothetical protein
MNVALMVVGLCAIQLIQPTPGSAHSAGSAQVRLRNIGKSSEA